MTLWIALMQIDEKHSFSVIETYHGQITETKQADKILYVQFSLSPPIKFLPTNPETNWSEHSCFNNKKIWSTTNLNGLQIVLQYYEVCNLFLLTNHNIQTNSGIYKQT